MNPQVAPTRVRLVVPPERSRDRHAPMLASAAGMMAGKAAAMSLGFAFWLVAARVAPADEVGLAAGATSAIMLVALLATAGLGPATVVEYHRSAAASNTVNAALTLSSAAGCAVGLVFLGLAGGLFDELQPIAGDVSFALAFVLMSAMGAVGVVLDHVSMAERRGVDVLVRNTANGLLTLSAPLLIWIGAIGASARWLFLGWVLGSVSAVLVGLEQIPRALPQHRTRPTLAWSTMAPILRTSAPNHVLTIAERAPGLVLPLLVTELLSPQENAYWYTSWMIAWGASIVPLSNATALLAEVTRESPDRSRAIRAAVRSSLMVGIPLAGIVVVAAPLLLGLAGSDYATNGADPLRLLVLTVIPLSATYPYYAVARSSGRITEAIVASIATGTVGLTAATLAGVASGLTAMAIAWLAVQTAAALWSAGRLRHLELTSSAFAAELRPDSRSGSSA